MANFCNCLSASRVNTFMAPVAVWKAKCSLYSQGIVIFQCSADNLHQLQKCWDTQTKKCFKSLLVRGLWDIILPSLLPTIQSCSLRFWAQSCITSNFDKTLRGDQKHKILDMQFKPKYSVSSIFATVAWFTRSLRKTCLWAELYIHGPKVICVWKTESFPIKDLLVINVCAFNKLYTTYNWKF